MLIASAAMFFAVAGSAFILRARMAAECCPRAHTPPPAAATADAPPAAVAEEPSPASSSYDCGHAIYSNNPDGTVSVTFPLCEKRDQQVRPPPDHIEVILIEE